MNLFALNGATLNGAPGVPIVAGGADVQGAALLLAAATLDGAMLAACRGQAFAGADAHVVAAAGADLAGAAYAEFRARHQQAAVASLDAGAEISAYQLRTVPASADIACSAAVLAIPASILAAADLAATARMRTDATKAQAASSALLAGAGVAAVASGVRNAGAAPTGTAALRAEAKRNNLLDGYANIVALAGFDLPDGGIVVRQAIAFIDGACALAPVASKTQGAGAFIRPVAQVAALPIVIVSAGSLAQGASCAVDAQATRVTWPALQVAGGAELALMPALQHAVAAGAHAGAAVVCAATRQAGAEANAHASSQAQAEAVCIRMADAAIDAGIDIDAAATLNLATTGYLIVSAAEMSANATVQKMGGAHLAGLVSVRAESLRAAMGAAHLAGSGAASADARIFRMAGASLAATAAICDAGYVIAMANAPLGAGADIDAQADAYSVLRFAEAAVRTQATAFSAATIIRPGAAPIAGDAGMRADARVSDRFYGEANTGGACHVTALAVTNAMAFDPLERTMRRPFFDRAMRRPFIDRTMRKSA